MSFHSGAARSSWDRLKFVPEVVGGWQLNSIDTFQTGTPFTVTCSSLLNAGSTAQWPNRIGSGALDQTIDRWFDPTPLPSCPPVTIFTAMRDEILTGPGTTPFDVSMFKNFSLGSVLTSAADSNSAPRCSTYSTLRNSTFPMPRSDRRGTITAAGSPPLFQRTSREIQLALKLYF